MTSFRAGDVDFRFTPNIGRFSASQRTVEMGQCTIPDSSWVASSIRYKLYLQLKHQDGEASRVDRIAPHQDQGLLGPERRLV
jgi:hypothetical protein